MPRHFVRLLVLCCFLDVCLPASRAGELSREPILRLDIGTHVAPVRRIDTDRAGRWVVSASDDKTVRVWDAETGRLERVLRPPIGAGREGELFSVALSPDGSLVACGGWTGAGSDNDYSVYIFSRATGRLVGRAPGMRAGVAHLAFSPDGSMLAATLNGEKYGGFILSAVDSRVAVTGGSGASSVRLSLIAEDLSYSAMSTGAHFSRDSRWLVTSSYDGYIRLYDLGSLNKAKNQGSKAIIPVVSRKTPGGSEPSSVKFSPDGSKIAVGFYSSPAVNILSAVDLKFLYAPDNSGATNGDLFSVAWSRDGRFLFAGGQFQRQGPIGWYCPLRRWTAGGEGGPNDLAIGTANSIMGLAPLPDGSLAVGTNDPAVAVLGPNGSPKWLVGVSIADYRASTLRLSPDGSKVNFAYKVSGGRPASFSLPDRSLIASQAGNPLAPPRTSAPGLDIREWENTATPTLNGQRLVLTQYEISHSLAIAADGESFLLGTDWFLRRFGRDGKEVWSVPTPGAAWAVDIAANSKVAAAAFGDGTIRWYRHSDGKELAAFFPHADEKRWVLWTSGGYYDASAGGEDLIGWHINNGPDKEADFYPASRFRGVKYRPDVVAKVLTTLDEAEALRLADAERGKTSERTTVAESLPPVIRISAPEDGSQVSATTVTLRYTVRAPSGAPVTGIRALIDGRPVAPSRNVKLVPTEKDEQAISVPIPARDCEVSLIAENRFSASAPATVRLTWVGGGQSEEFVAKPKLYLLAVGESVYQNPAYRLGFAAKDATDFAAAMQAQKGGLYRDVEVKLLPDAPKEDIEDGLDWLQHQVTSRDVGMIFLAGHGVNDNTGTYYFLPANADLEHLKKTGLVFSDIKTTVASIAGKVVMFVDTCHSGNVMGTRRGGPADIDAVVNELSSAENGVVVFTASTGRQYSLEDAQWQNGAFTKALVEGISGKAEHQGKITVATLDFYLSERVKELTKGQQTPTSTKPETVPDFPLAVKK